jgi:hypothetical protein
MWCKISVDGNVFHNLFAIGAGTDGSQEAQVLANFTGSNANLHCWNGAVSGSGTAATLAVGTWFHLGVVVQDPDAAQDDVLIYLNGTLDFTLANIHDNVSPATNLKFGNNKDSENINGCLGPIKIWSGVELTASEFSQEMRQYIPVRIANLNAWNPLLTHNDLVDYSSNGNALTAGGTLATEDGPPIPWRCGRPRILSLADSGGGSPPVLAPVGSFLLMGCGR